MAQSGSNAPQFAGNPATDTSRISAAFERLVADVSASGRSLMHCAPPGANGSAAPRALARRLLTLSAVSYVLAVAGCSSYSTEREFKAYPTSAAAPAHRRSEPQTLQSNRALLAPQRAPDCEFKGPDRDTVDADLWARLKLDYERHCYEHAEMIVRNRLQLLQASSSCATEPDRRSRRFVR